MSGSWISDPNPRLESTIQSNRSDYLTIRSWGDRNPKKRLPDDPDHPIVRFLLTCNQIVKFMSLSISRCAINPISG